MQFNILLSFTNHKFELKYNYLIIYIIQYKINNTIKLFDNTSFRFDSN